MSSMQTTLRTVLDIWSEVLERGEPPQPADNFFALGGDSIGVMSMLFRIQETLGVEMSPGVLFEAPTPAELARLIDEQIRLK